MAKLKSHRKVWVGLLVFALCAIGLSVCFVQYVPSGTLKADALEIGGNVGLPLEKPPLCVLVGSPLDPDYGNPLDTSNIGLFCYYNQTSGWTLNDTVPAFTIYTDHGNYIDGEVTVWQDATGNTYAGSDFNTTVMVRVRADGWIMAWTNKTQERGELLFYGHNRLSYGTLTINATSLSRAIERVFYASGQVFCGYSAVRYWDFEYDSSTRLIIFGRETNRTSTTVGILAEHFYFTIKNTVWIEHAIVCFGGGVQTVGGQNVELLLKLDSAQLYRLRVSPSYNVSLYSPPNEYRFGWTSVDVSGSVTAGVKADVLNSIEDYYDQIATTRITSTVMLWLSN